MDYFLFDTSPDLFDTSDKQYRGRIVYGSYFSLKKPF
jgi:hypothetical protein